MDSNFNEFMDEFNVHTSTSNSNPHKVNVVGIYNSTIDDSTKDITNLPFAKCEQNV